MTGGTVVKGVPALGRLVAVIASPTASRRALVLSKPPDFFELRLDALWPVLPEIARDLRQFRAPFIVTARHPAEGGRNDLTLTERRAVLLRFLPQAKGVDVELRRAHELRAVLRAAKEHAVPRILSVHEMLLAIHAPRMQRFLEKAVALGASIFKIVVRTETIGEVDQLLQFFERNKSRLPIAAMATGRFGREARLELARAGSALNYVHLGRSNIEGQLSLAEMRRATESWRIS